MTMEMAAISTTPLQSPKLCDPAPEIAAAPTAITSNASTSSTRSTTTVALASPTPIPGRRGMQDHQPAPAAHHDQGEEGGLGDQDPAGAGAPDGAPDLGWVHRPDH